MSLFFFLELSRGGPCCQYCDIEFEVRKKKKKEFEVRKTNLS